MSHDIGNIRETVSPGDRRRRRRRDRDLKTKAAEVALRGVAVEVVFARGSKGSKSVAGTLRQLGIDGKKGAVARRPLTNAYMGAVSKVANLVDARIVLKSGTVRESSPQEVVNLLRNWVEPAVTAYDVDGRPARFITCGAADEAIVERYADFCLVSWSSRATPISAYRILQHIAEPDAQMLVVSVDGLLFPRPADPLPRELESVSHLIRLLRVENEKDTLIWEVPFNGFGAFKTSHLRPVSGAAWRASLILQCSHT
ncbi:hypothetical protein Prum_070480 [Phytohabitans rumicis]|uniref:Uncharacterized protein n=1 Tax=Phytohabitans rumicis TaxID=1076125 RepID=A0A6V8LH34_9ACTN|nr:hypothetical protein Prum_070480 [Phytohabitans rumicis]